MLSEVVGVTTFIQTLIYVSPLSNLLAHHYLPPRHIGSLTGTDVSSRGDTSCQLLYLQRFALPVLSRACSRLAVSCLAYMLLEPILFTLLSCDNLFITNDRTLRLFRVRA